MAKAIAISFINASGDNEQKFEQLFHTKADDGKFDANDIAGAIDKFLATLQPHLDFGKMDAVKVVEIPQTVDSLEVGGNGTVH